ncbi:Disks large-associated protein 4 isoform X2 [Aix galericulata]|nr:Disks large-associated protein 4 isoform X2 [Aix galericulata]
MKGLGDNRSRHLSDNLDSPQDSLYAPQDRNPYLLSPTDSFTMDPRFPAQNTLHGDCLLPLNNQISNSSTFPRIHYNSHFEVPDENPFPSHAQATKINRLPANLLDQFEKQLPIHRDGFSTLQFQRSDAKHRSESPGRIRHLVHSVQKLFAKSQSLEGPTKGNVNGKKGADDPKQNRRSKSKDRAKTSEPKRRTRSNISGWWSSDDNLDSDTCSYRNPMGLMTLGRQPDHSQPKYFMHAYNTISEHMLKSSKSNNDLKVTPCTNIPINNDSNYIKRGSWSTLTLSHAREVCQKASATIDKALLKSKSCHQDLAYHYLQPDGGLWAQLGGVSPASSWAAPPLGWEDTGAAPLPPSEPPRRWDQPLSPGPTDAGSGQVPQGEWNNTLSRDKDSEIPCRRMRSGSYIKAMGDDDSEDSETSPKPSPKTAARRQSYLKATQQSLSEQSTTQRSLDRLDSVEILLPPKFPTWEEEYNQISDSVNESSCINQAREPELGEQYEAVCDSTYSEAESAAAEVLDLPLPSYFRSRSHSYLRAIQAGCSQDEDTGSIRSISPPPAGSLSGSRTLPTNSECQRGHGSRGDGVTRCSNLPFSCLHPSWHRSCWAATSVGQLLRKGELQPTRADGGRQNLCPNAGSERGSKDPTAAASPPWGASFELLPCWLQRPSSNKGKPRAPGGAPPFPPSPSPPAPRPPPGAEPAPCGAGRGGAGQGAWPMPLPPRLRGDARGVAAALKARPRPQRAGGAAGGRGECGGSARLLLSLAGRGRRSTERGPSPGTRPSTAGPDLPAAAERPAAPPHPSTHPP